MVGRLVNMCKNLSVSATRGSYLIEIGKSVSAITQSVNDIWLVDKKIMDRLPALNKVISIDASEETKSLETCIEVMHQMKILGANRDSKLIAVGGGVTQDIATLCASLYMRGLTWTFIPTTKMAQLDSCIGGKSSINLSGIKNLVGNIYPPSHVVIDFVFDETLSNEALVAGYLEAIKISFARGSSQFNSHLEISHQYEHLEDISRAELCFHVLEHKKYFIEEDENDLGVRQLLNFGHTFGHALESASNYGFHHGVAIGLGMLMALEHPLSHSDFISERLKETILTLLKHAGMESVLALSQISSADFYYVFDQDKKHSLLNHNLILYTPDGLAKIPILKSDEEKKWVVDCFESVRGALTNELW
jgi:3-dehydroquinate synthase